MKNFKERVAVIEEQSTRTHTPLPAEDRHGEADELERFIYRASHDLRGPLSRLMGLCNVAALEVSDVQALSYLYKIACAASEMDEMLHKVLKIELVKQKEFSITPLNLSERITHIIETVLAEEGRPQVSFNIHTPQIPVYTDAFLFELAIENMVRNAVQYRITSERVNSEVTVCGRIEGHQLLLTISDNGTGIAPEHQPRMFEMFFRGSELSKGPGLGLYLSWLCMKRLGGLVRLLESRPQFTVFELQVPMGLWG
ncbi:sensor histidine kinase [Rhodoflexus sp.]